MARIPLGSSQRNVSDEYKAKLYVRIAMLYLEDDDEVSADSYVARSHSIVGKADFTNLEVSIAPAHRHSQSHRRSSRCLLHSQNARRP